MGPIRREIHAPRAVAVIGGGDRWAPTDSRAADGSGRRYRTTCPAVQRVAEQITASPRAFIQLVSGAVTTPIDACSARRARRPARAAVKRLDPHVDAPAVPAVQLPSSPALAGARETYLVVAAGVPTSTAVQRVIVRDHTPLTHPAVVRDPVAVVVAAISTDLRRRVGIATAHERAESSGAMQPQFSSRGQSASDVHERVQTERSTSTNVSASTTRHRPVTQSSVATQGSPNARIPLASIGGSAPSEQPEATAIRSGSQRLIAGNTLAATHTRTRSGANMGSRHLRMCRPSPSGNRPVPCTWQSRSSQSTTGLSRSSCRSPSSSSSRLAHSSPTRRK